MGNEKLTTESENEYIWRICSMKESKEWTWTDIANIINANLGYKYGESCYRKKFQMWSQMVDGNVIKSNGIDEKYVNLIRQEKDELFKAKKQFQDQRREYNKILTIDARSEHLTEEIIRAANSLNVSKMLNSNDELYLDANNDAVLVLTDWHFGMVTDNVWNKYNVDICVNRVSELVSRTKKHLRTHNVNKLHIVLLGDFIHGALHSTCRVAAEEDTCDQLMKVSELLAEVIDGLNSAVNEVYVYSTYGNHARTVQNKNDSIHSDNMEKIIPFWLKQRFINNNNVHIVDSTFYEFIYLNVLGHDIVAVHGDLDRFDKLCVDMHTLFSKQYGIDVEYVFSGDKHHYESSDMFGIDNVMVSSLCGTDEYANNRRLYSKPGQTLCIFNKEDGKLCTYNITF